MLLEIDRLSVAFGDFHAVRDFSMSVAAGEAVGIVGESGCGKSVAMLALMGLVGYPSVVAAKRLRFDDRELLSLPARARRAITGKDVAMIFQEPLTSLNPCYTVGFQITEALKIHQRLGRRQRRRRTMELLEQVGIPDPEHRMRLYPHQLSGGMNQRMMIAMAIACNPKLLIADEPTTALDVTIQAQILDLLVELQRRHGMALILITHDMAVVAQTARSVNVMYAGQIVERGPAKGLFQSPRHPYTNALLESLPEHSSDRERLPTIPGVVPGPFDRPTGCLFHSRCSRADTRCRQVEPEMRRSGGGAVRCFHPVGGQV